MVDEIPNQDLIPMSESFGMPAVIIPQPFSLERADKTDLAKLKSEGIEKAEHWETAMTGFFNEFFEYADSWRMIPRSGSKKPRGLFNSKSGETNRATNTLASLEQRMLTAGDPFFEAVAEGLTDDGFEIPEDDLYATEAVLNKQLRVLHFKRKLLKTLRSKNLFGTAIVEEPWISRPYGSIAKTFEGTDIVHRSLLQTGYDPFVFDLDMSDYIFTVDFMTIHKLRQLATIDPDTWDKEFIESTFKTFSHNKGTNAQGAMGNVYQRIIQRKNRAGYSQIGDDLLELISYHGKLDTENSVLQQLWESLGRTDDLRYADWSMGIMHGEEVVRLHPEPYGTWHHSFKIAHNNEFELEPIGYGVGKIGRKSQRELDVTQSRMNDILMFSLFSMFKLGRFSGLKANQLTIKPWNIVEMDDISQLEVIRPQIEAIAQALAMQGIIKEDFRTTTGATANLQAIITKATATEASLTQSEAIRGASVLAEITAETFLREHIETMHINNLDLLDNDIYVAISGKDKPIIKRMNRENLPKNVGFNVKVVTDKDFRPERLQKILEFLQFSTSIRNDLPIDINIVPFFEEAARAMGVNPRKMKNAVTQGDRILNELKKAQRNNPKLLDELSGEQADEQAGGLNMKQTPVGAVPTSPLGSSLVEGI